MLAAHLHDAAAGLAIGVASLKGIDRSAEPSHQSDLRQVTEALEGVLADLKSLSRSVVANATQPSPPADLVASLMREAGRAGVILELDMVGRIDWLGTGQAELVYLTAREAIRNVKRHSGSATCRISIELSDCPFVLRARDWGSGISPQSRPGDGIFTLKQLATTLGCELVITSQPGLGTELILVGRWCPRNWGDRSGRPELRSVVAKESLSSRRRVAARRPNGPSGQQIS